MSFVVSENAPLPLCQTSSKQTLIAADAPIGVIHGCSSVENVLMRVLSLLRRIFLLYPGNLQHYGDRLLDMYERFAPVSQFSECMMFLTWSFFHILLTPFCSKNWCSISRLKEEISMFCKKRCHMTLQKNICSKYTACYTLSGFIVVQVSASVR